MIETSWRSKIHAIFLFVRTVVKSQLRRHAHVYRRFEGSETWKAILKREGELDYPLRPDAFWDLEGTSGHYRVIIEEGTMMMIEGYILVQMKQA